MLTHRENSVLIVEDEQIVAADLQLTLREMGYDAYAIASSAEEAIAAASQTTPDVVLMDIRIKGKRDGIETARILRTLYGVPIVYITAHADDVTIERAKKTEPHGYLVKPVRVADLRSVLEVARYKHEMEKRLRERERWLSTTLLSIADGVIAVDLSGTVTFMNAMAETLTGATVAVATGKPVRDILHVVRADTPDAETPVLRALREGRSIANQEGTLFNVSSGAQRLITDSAAPVVDAEQTLGAVMVFRDVTEQKKLQKRLEMADRLASLGTMAAGVAHEVNSPLAVVVANADLLVAEMDDLRSGAVAANVSLPAEAERLLARMEECLPDIQYGAERIRMIVSGLRGFSHFPQRYNSDVNVARCIEWAVHTTTEEFRHRARLITKLNDVPLVAADEARLGQVIINLLVNAAQAIAPGQEDRNRVSIEARSSDDGRVVVEVQDTGSGIPTEILGHIFEPFFTTKDVGVGTGLGLSICHGLVTSFGGDIEVESEVGRGSVFRVLLNAAAPKESLSLLPPERGACSAPPTSSGS